MPETILVTGGFGCIGAETTKWLLRNTDASIVVASRRVTPERVERTFHDVDQDRLEFTELDVRDKDRVQSILQQQKIARVVHLAALQTPDCNANRDLGLQVNLAATQVLIESMKACDHAIERFVFASSAAVYGPRASYATDRIPMLAAPDPVNVYGVWKLAGEQLTKFFAADTGIPAVSLRPGVLYGPGRDAGLTSTPTTAMKHVTLGLPYEIPFRSKQDYLYAPDVGAAFGHALTAPFAGYGAFTLPSHTLTTAEIVAVLENVAASLNLACNVAIGTEEVPFICDLEFAPFLDASLRHLTPQCQMLCRNPCEHFACR